MPTDRQCAKCGAGLAPFGAAALCPNCMLREAIRLGADLTSHTLAAGIVTGPAAAATPVAEKHSGRIGRYKLLQQIGEGGMGIVYMAEQEEPVRRRVALKVIRLGMDTKNVIARFEAERQALALMDHPNIARVLEAGATDSGRPFFVMELVRGTKITDYCDQQNLSTSERLGLFVQVCQAIQHAHQKGVIHRDLKPSNILVTLRDGVPVPKVIDFGIAKATTDQPLTDKTLFTAIEQFLGTPAYMSPEQAEMSELGVDTRSDIYSLGVLLYELLTGQTPFDAKDLLQAGLDAMRRIIREREPERPSTRLSTLLEGELTTTAKRRRSEPVKLIHLVRGELDWIVMKCLEKDRGRRYETANGLARDVERFLADEPVVACPPSRVYRFQKLVRRNKLAFAAIGAVAAALVLGLGLSTWLLFREKAARQRALEAEQQANQARASEAAQRRQAEEARATEAELRLQAQGEERKAQTAASKSQEVARLLEEMLQGVGPSVALGHDTTILREILDKMAKRIGKDLTNQPDVELELRATLANTYHELGLYRQMEEMARQGLQLSRSRPGEENEAVAGMLASLGDALMHLGNLDEAEKFTREGLAVYRKVLGDKNRGVATSLDLLSQILEEQGKLADAEITQREALALRKKFWGKEHPDIATSLNNLAAVLAEEHKLTKAETMDREALAMARDLFGEESPLIASSFNILANVLREQGKLTEAEAMFRQALVMRRKLLGPEHTDVATSLNNLATVLADQHKFAEAEPMFRQALAMRKTALGTEHPKVANTLLGMANVAEQQGELAEAETTFREALSVLRNAPANDPSRLEWSIANLAACLRGENKDGEAEPLWREALASARTFSTNDVLRLETRLADLADCLRSQERYAESEVLYREAAASAWHTATNDAPRFEIRLNDLAEVLHTQGKADELERFFTDILDLPPERQPLSASLLRGRAGFFARRGRWKEAVADFSRLVEIEPENCKVYYWLTPLLVRTGDLQGYRRNCAQVVARLDGINDPNTAGRMAEDCLMLPDSGVDLSAVAAWVDTAVSANKNSRDFPWFQFCKGLAEYRQRHFVGSITWMQKVLSYGGENVSRDVEAYMVLAMAQYRSKQAGEARVTLAKGIEIAESGLPKLDGGDIGEGWPNWLIAHGLMMEAKGLIEGNARTGSEAH